MIYRSALHLFLIPCFFSQSVAQDKLKPKMDTSEWGTMHAGLRCRASADTEIEQSTPINVSVEFQSEPKYLDPKVRQLNWFFPDAELTLKNVKSDKQFRVRPYSPMGGGVPLDSGKNGVPLDGTPLKPWQVSFPLLAVSPELEPGIYEARVRISFPQMPRYWHQSEEAWRAAGFWHGDVESGVIRLEVKKELLKSKTFLLPKNLRLEKGLTINYSKDDAEEVEVKLRNGHFVSARYYHYDDDNKIKGMTLTAVPTPGDVNPISSIRNYRGGDWTATIKTEIIEYRPGDLSARFGGDGAKILWTRTFKLSFTEKEIRQKQ